MKRVLAVIGALLLIGGALLIRSRGQAEEQRAADERAKATLYCAEELEAVCARLRDTDRNLTVVTEDANRTLATVTAPDFDPATTRIDGWLAPAPYVELANESRQRAGAAPLFSSPGRVLARSPIVMAMWRDRQQALQAACGGQITWRCVGEQAGKPWEQVNGSAQWGEVKAVLPAPDRSATGQLALGEAASSFFGRTDFASNDFADPAFREWLGRLARSSTGVSLSTPTPLEQMLFAGPASLDLAASLEAQAAPAIAGSRDKDRLSILYPSPLATTDVVLAPVDGSEPGGRLQNVLESDDATRAFADAGWRVDGQPAPPGASAAVDLPDGSGLPRAGVLQALGSLWQGAS